VSVMVRRGVIYRKEAEDGVVVGCVVARKRPRREVVSLPSWRRPRSVATGVALHGQQGR
jgi:hypothetical protein